MDGLCFSFDYYFRYVNLDVLYKLSKCVQSYTSVKTVLLRAIPTVIRTYYYDQNYGSALCSVVIKNNLSRYCYTASYKLE